MPRWPIEKLSDDRVLELFRLRLANRPHWTLYRLAEHFDVHFMYVQYVLKGECRTSAHPDHPDRLKCVAAERALLARYRRDAKRLPAARAKGIRLYLAGYSLRAAAAAAGIGWNTLRRYLLTARVPLRRRGPPSPKTKAVHCR